LGEVSILLQLDQDGVNPTFSSAGYAVELAIGFGALTLATIVVGVTTHSRRRRIWRAVAGLVVFHAILQLVAFVLVVDQYRTGRFPTTFLEVKLGPYFSKKLVS
jgi:hypothetical protein